MRNPWVHDDVSGAAGSGYGGRVRLLGAVVWGTLLLVGGGIALLVGTGTVDPGFAGSLGSAVTYAVGGAALVLLSPLILRLLAVSRLLAAVAFLACGWLVGEFVWSRESERILELLPSEVGIGSAAEPIGGLFELAEALFALL